MIYDNDSTPLTVTADPMSVGEAASNRTAPVTVSVPEGSEPATDAGITFSPSGTAKRGTDYTMASGVTLPANQSSVTTTLEVTDDAIYEGPETIRLQATHSDYQASEVLEIALIDNDLPRLMLTVDTASVSEPNGTATLTVTVPAGEAPAADATLTLEHTGSATNGTDYRVGTLVIADGELSGTARLEVIDDAVYEGTEEIWLQAAKTGYKISRTLKIPLEDKEQNQAPVVSPPLPDLTINVGEERTLTLSSHFSDPEGHSLTYAVTSLETDNVTVSVNGSSLRLTGVEVGSATITVTATDQPEDSQEPLSDTKTFTATVENRDPECEDIAGQTVKVGKSKTVAVSCSDPNGDTLTYSASSSDTSMVTVTVSGSSLTVTGVAVTGSPKPTVTVKATDSGNLMDTVTFPVTVPLPPCSLSSISNQTVNMGKSKTLSLPDTDDCTYTASSSDTSKVTVSVNNATDTLTVTGVAVGSATVTVRVGSQSKTFTVTVVMPSPVISHISPNQGQTDTRATIYGANFGTDQGSVSFGGSSAEINSWISVLVPLHLPVGSVSVSVTTAGGKTSNSVSFRVTGSPVSRDEEEECEDAKDCPEDEGEGEEKGEEEGEEESGDSGETEEDPDGG